MTRPLRKADREAEGRVWFVIQTRPAQEYKAVASFELYGLEVYHPQEIVWRKSGRTKTEHSRPYIRGYVFAKLGPGDLYKLHDMEGVSYALPIPQQAILVKFIDWLKAEEATGIWDHTRAEKARRGGLHAVARGTPVRIFAGAYQGFTATFLRMEGRGRARVMLSLFGKDTEALVPEGQMERSEAA